MCTQRRACTGDFSQPELPSPATRFHGLLACISTNGFLMGGSVTLDRNPSQYYRDWGYSSILVLHRYVMAALIKSESLYASIIGEKFKTALFLGNRDTLIFCGIFAQPSVRIKGAV